MKKLKRIFLLSVLLLWGYGLSLSALQPEFSTSVEIRRELNLLQSERRNLHQNYMMIWIQYQSEQETLNETTPSSLKKLQQQTQTENEAENSSEWLSDWLNQGSNLFNQFDNQLAELLERLEKSETITLDLRNMLLQANETIDQLSAHLAKATIWAEQMGERLQENNEDLAEAYDRLDLLEQQNVAFKIEAEKYRKQAGRNAVIGFSFAGVGFGVGTPLLIEGIQTDNQTMLWSGAGTIIGTTGIWLLGHYVFRWW